MSAPEDFAILARKLEDGCNIAESDGEAAQISIAISAKRQADYLERIAKQIEAVVNWVGPEAANLRCEQRPHR